jgi:serine/threonine-protein kinase RsbW
MYPHARERRLGATSIDLSLEERVQALVMHSPAELGPIAEKLERWMRVLGYPSKDLFAVTLAAREAVTNAYRHGNRCNRKKCIHFRYLVTPDEVLLEVEDEGRGFDPQQVTDPLAEGNLDRPGGRGLFLMRVYMTWVTFNREGNRVTLSRQRSRS